MSEDVEVITISFKAGNAKPGELKQFEEKGIDVNKLAEDLNRKTKYMKGKDVSARIFVYPRKKEYYIEIIPPTTTELLLWKAGASEPSGDPMHKKVGDLKIKDVIEVAIAKKSELLTRDLKKAVKMMLGSARSIGLTVEGKDPKVVTREVEEGVYDDVIKEYEKEWREA